MPRNIKVDMTFTATVPDGQRFADIGSHDLADLVRWNNHLGTLNDVDLALGAVEITSAVETHREIRPGDLVAHRTADLDPREVIAVGRDWLTLDLLGEESPRLAKDDYRVDVPADGVL